MWKCSLEKTSKVMNNIKTADFFKSKKKKKKLPNAWFNRSMLLFLCTYLVCWKYLFNIAFSHNIIFCLIQQWIPYSVKINWVELIQQFLCLDHCIKGRISFCLDAPLTFDWLPFLSLTLFLKFFSNYFLMVLLLVLICLLIFLREWKAIGKIKFLKIFWYR